jgi:FMN reductase
MSVTRPSVVVISGSPSKTSRTERMADALVGRLAEATPQVSHLCLRTLPPGPLLAADTADAVISDAVRAVEQADGIVLATPTYKAAYSGMLKVFLDLLPRCAFAGKVVLPVATGGSLAHVLALDYALRPVVQSLGARHVVQGFFVLDCHLVMRGEELDIQPESRAGLESVLSQFRSALHVGGTELD